VATVPQLCIGGTSAASLPHAPSIIPPATTVSAPELDRNQSLPALVALGAPESSAIDIRTRNGNWTHLFSGSFWHAPAITTHGELQAIDKGHARFSVAAALGYFAVVMPRFLARVKGTIFDVDYEPGQYVTFSVSEGTVAIVRITAIHLQDENRTIDGIRETDIITAVGKNIIKYKLPLTVDQQYKNADEATKALNAQLQAATENGDPQLIDDSLNNIQLVTGKPVAFGGAHIAQGSAANASVASGTATSLATLAIAAASVGILTSANKSGTTSNGNNPPNNNGSQTGSITLTSAGRSAIAVPTATPTATPHPVPSPTPKSAATAPPAAVTPLPLPPKPKPH
jgi:hypothetical protein